MPGQLPHVTQNPVQLSALHQALLSSPELPDGFSQVLRLAFAEQSLARWHRDIFLVHKGLLEHRQWCLRCVSNPIDLVHEFSLATIGFLSFSLHSRLLNCLKMSLFSLEIILIDFEFTGFCTLSFHVRFFIIELPRACMTLSLSSIAPDTRPHYSWPESSRRSLTTHAVLAITRGGMQAPFNCRIAHLDLPTAGLDVWMWCQALIQLTLVEASSLHLDIRLP